MVYKNPLKIDSNGTTECPEMNDLLFDKNFTSSVRCKAVVKPEFRKSMTRAFLYGKWNDVDLSPFTESARNVLQALDGRFPVNRVEAGGMQGVTYGETSGHALDWVGCDRKGAEFETSYDEETGEWIFASGAKGRVFNDKYFKEALKEICERIDLLDLYDGALLAISTHNIHNCYESYRMYDGIYFKNSDAFKFTENGVIDTSDPLTAIGLYKFNGMVMEMDMDKFRNSRYFTEAEKTYNSRKEECERLLEEYQKRKDREREERVGFLFRRKYVDDMLQEMGIVRYLRDTRRSGLSAEVEIPVIPHRWIPSEELTEYIKQKRNEFSVLKGNNEARLELTGNLEKYLKEHKEMYTVTDSPSYGMFIYDLDEENEKWYVPQDEKIAKSNRENYIMFAY